MQIGLHIQISKGAQLGIQIASIGIKLHFMRSFIPNPYLQWGTTGGRLDQLTLF